MHVGLKNAIELIGDLSDYYDFGINESCHVWNECGVSIPAPQPRFGLVVYVCCFSNGVYLTAHMCAVLCTFSRYKCGFLLP